MAKATVLRLRRGTGADHATFTGAQSEVTHNTTTDRLHLHDGTTEGGIPLARLDDVSQSGGGTVVSVDASVPTGFAVAGTPINSSGTIAITYSDGYQGYTTAEATKLAGIATGADKTPGVATTSANGLMSSADKTKLNSIVVEDLMLLGGTIDYGTIADE